MLSSLRKANAGGYRAGRCGTFYGNNPYKLRRQCILAWCWLNGHDKGIRERLTGKKGF